MSGEDSIRRDEFELLRVMSQGSESLGGEVVRDDTLRKLGDKDWLVPEHRAMVRII
jgi:hypothetical protein